MGDEMKADYVLTKQKKTFMGSEWKKQYLKVRDGKFSFADVAEGVPNREGSVLGVRVLEANREQIPNTFLWKIYYHTPRTQAAQALKQSMEPVLIKSETKDDRRSWMRALKSQGARVDSLTLLEGNLTYVSTYEKFKAGKPHPKPLYALVYNGVLQFYKTRKDWAEYNPAIEIDLLQGSKIVLSDRDTFKDSKKLYELTDHLGGIHMLAVQNETEAKKWTAAIEQCIFAPSELDTPGAASRELAASNPTSGMASPVRESQFFSPVKTEEEEDLTTSASGRAKSKTKNDSQGPAVHFRGASIDVGTLDLSGLKKEIPSPSTESIAE